MASLENHLRSKNQLQPQVEQELKKVKDVVKLDPTLVSLSKELEYRSLSKLLK
jgi:hypothetical protein